MIVHSKTRAYKSWASMYDRCLNPQHEAYERYAGRGITICSEWLLFKNFFRDMGERPEKMSLERIDNDKGYFPQNCKWATMKEQQRNKRSNVRVAHNGRMVTIAELSEIVGVDRKTLEKRVRKYKITGERLFQKSCIRKGNDHPRSKLTQDQITALKKDAASMCGKYGYKAALSRKYNTSDSNVEFILNGRTWK